MYKLIKKNFLINKIVIRESIFLILAALVFFKSVVVAALMLPMSLFFQIIFVDEKDRLESLYFSFPIKRSSIVFSKYLEIFIFTIIGTILSIIIAYLLELLLPDAIFTLGQIFSFKDLYAITFSIILVVSLFTPFFLAFGSVRGFFLGIGAVLAFFLMLLVASYIVVLKSDKSIDSFRQGLLRLSDFLDQIITQIKIIIGREMFLAVLFIMVLIMLAGSIFISLNIYKKKEI